MQLIPWSYLSRDNALLRIQSIFILINSPILMHTFQMVIILIRSKDFSLLHSDRTESMVHSASFPIRIVFFSLEAKRPGSEADHSPPSSAEVTNGGAEPLYLFFP
jgi:hypothetical protein